MLKFFVTAATVLVIGACSTQPKTSVPRPVIKSIAIVPATNPKTYTIQNVSALQFVIPFAGAAHAGDSKDKTVILNQRMAGRIATLASSFTESVAAALRIKGYQVQVLAQVARSTDDPDDVDYDRLTTNADAILHLKFTQVGLYSSYTSTAYLPRVNVRGMMYLNGKDDVPYDQEIYYGGDARDGKPWAIASDPQFAIADFQSVLGNLDGVVKMFHAGVAAITDRMSTQIHDSIKPL